MCNYTYFAKDPSWWEESYQVVWGYHNICPLLKQLQVTMVTQPELSSLSHAGVWGDAKKFWSHLAFLLILPKRIIEGEIVFRLTVVWAHPYQAQFPSLDEAVKKLILLNTSGRNWAYTFVQLNKDAKHVPLPKEGHLNTMIEGVPHRNACGHFCQLEECQLLQWEDQVVYPEGLNGGLEPVVTSLPESLAHGMSVFNELTFLQVDFSQVTPGDHVSKASAPHRTLTPTSPSHLVMEHSPKAESHISMTAEV